MSRSGSALAAGDANTAPLRSGDVSKEGDEGEREGREREREGEIEREREREREREGSTLRLLLIAFSRISGSSGGCAE